MIAMTIVVNTKILGFVVVGIITYACGFLGGLLSQDSFLKALVCTILLWCILMLVGSGISQMM